MPTPYQGGFNSGLERVSKRRKIAEAIAGQSLVGQNQTQMVGSGPYQIAVPNYGGPVAQIAQALAGKHHLEKADQEEQALRTARREDIAKAMTTFWPALQDPAATPEARQTAAAGLVGYLEPEDMRAASAQILRGAFDPREVSARRAAQVSGDISQKWRNQPARPMPAGEQPALMTDQGELVQTGGMEQPDLPDTESPEYFQFAAQQYEQAGLPQEAEKARREAEKIAKAAKKEAVAESKDQFKMTAQLRDDYRQDSKVFKGVSEAYGRLLASAKNPDAAGDISMVFSYMKMLDPLSTILPGEYAKAENVGTVDQRVWAAYNRLLGTGEQLNPEIRTQFVNRAAMIYDQSKTQWDVVDQNYKRYAQSLGIDPRNMGVIGPVIEQPGKQKKAEAKPEAKPEAKAAPAKAAPGKAAPAVPADPLGIR